MNSSKERIGPYGRESSPQVIIWHPTTHASPQSSPSRRKFSQQKLRVANGIYGVDISSPPKTKKHRPQHGVPIIMDMRELLRKTRGVSGPRNNARGLSFNDLRNGHDATEGPESPGSPMSKFKENLSAASGVSIGVHAMHAFVFIIISFIANMMFVVARCKADLQPRLRSSILTIL